MKLLQCFLICILPISLYAHGVVALSIAISFLSVCICVFIIKLLSLKYFENILMKHSFLKLLFLFVLEFITLIVLYGGCSNALTWDILKVVYYLFFPLALILNYLFFIIILNNKMKALLYSLIFVLLTIIVSWGYTISRFECSTSYGLHKCNFFSFPDSKNLTLFGNNILK